jgi:hypothetical protein
MLALSLQYAGAFALIGPLTAPGVDGTYQVPQIGYRLPGDVGTPRNLGEEYRWNTPDLYYAFDQNFLDYFGSNGVVAVEQAISILNHLTNFSNLSPELSEYPLEATAENYRAGALFLLDLKSTALALFVEQLGLAEPERYVWTLRNRAVGQGGCPGDVAYTVIQRNFDPVFSALDQLQTSSYVNGTLYSYAILELCTSPVPPIAEALELPVDPLANTFSAVASHFIFEGLFYTGLTRDDVGGLRYLYRTNNMNFESTTAGSETIFTNFNASQLLFTSNLTLLVNQALTNDAATLAALFPGLVITSSTPIFTNIVTTNVFFFFTNLPWAPAGSAATLVGVTNKTTNVVTWFRHTFANVVTNTYYTKGFITVLTTNVGPAPFAPPGIFQTNVTTTRVFTNFVNGDYYILPTNSNCGVVIVHTQLTSVVNSTNVFAVATNAPGVTNVSPQQFSQSLVFHFTNRVFVIHPVACVPTVPTLRQGMNRVKFIRRDFDSLIGQFFEPITNLYTLVTVTNSTAIPQTIRRVVSQPDFLITAADLVDGPPGPGGVITINPAGRSIQFNTANALPNLAGPGTIEPPVTFTFNKVGPIYGNTSPGFLDELSQIPLLIWGSFDATTNAPVVYPNGTSILNLENQVLIMVAPSSLPDGEVGIPYSATFSVTAGGLSPFVWSLSPNSPALPPDLTVSPSGLLSGTPTSAGTYDFSIRVTDAGSRTVDRPYTIKINP